MFTIGPAFVTTLLIASAQATNDYSWIHRFASIGDSYAAGLGASERLDWSCSRYNGSYPSLLHSKYLGHPSSRSEQLLACSGATTADVIEKQLPHVKNNTDLITITAGGNDVGLTPVLNDCIYKFYAAGDCESSLAEARERIADKGKLHKNMTELLDAVKPKLNNTRGVAYVTGYASFFGADDDTCDNVTWAVWKEFEADKPLLTLAMRKQLNELVRSVNDMLKSITEAAGPKFRFIDYDEQIKHAKGRYCEAGVVEPAANRKGLDFYEWDTVDTGESVDTLEMTGDDVPRGSFEAYISESIARTLKEHPEWEFSSGRGLVNKTKMHDEGLAGDIVWWMLPDTWKRVFHLRPGAHEIIAQMIVDDLTVVAVEQQSLNKPASLIFFGAATLSAIFVFLLLLALYHRRKHALATKHDGYQLGDSMYFDDDEVTLAAVPTESPPANFKQYSTFD
ncbi:SGNH hydrolase [Aaosphaeria arxii CBS 175.79]|uniref:SGNH hydrolase n=1 Tax=Aaosphaeria arxii CBS 175.79 TaxID=1450172 RepID=A0A6A5XIL3_9PLEO|nr:SGNH hydrolase [Aaosphaeria arxii CBS 175.79]KAF2012671.1 SGNH hydrolase [Aaosphaeria arxii CBS 175.79]